MFLLLHPEDHEDLREKKRPKASANDSNSTATTLLVKSQQSGRKFLCRARGSYGLS